MIDHFHCFPSHQSLPDDCAIYPRVTTYTPTSSRASLVNLYTATVVLSQKMISGEELLVIDTLLQSRSGRWPSLEIRILVSCALNYYSLCQLWMSIKLDAIIKEANASAASWVDLLTTTDGDVANRLSYDAGFKVVTARSGSIKVKTPVRP